MPASAPDLSPPSQDAQRRRRGKGGLRRRVLVPLAVVLAVAVAVPLALFLPGEQAAGRPDQQALSLRFAAESLRVRDDQPDLARRLAVAAYRAAPTQQARASVYSLLAATETTTATLTADGSSVTSATFSPDGTLLATVGFGGSTARLWDYVMLSPDGTLLATGGGGETIQLWDFDVGRLVDDACADPANQLTADQWAAVAPELPYEPPCG